MSDSATYFGLTWPSSGTHTLYRYLANDVYNNKNYPFQNLHVTGFFLSCTSWRRNYAFFSLYWRC